MKIIKRSGVEAAFDRSKITAAVTKANESVAQGKRLTKKQIELIGDNVTEIASNRRRALSVEEIQDIVENQIMSSEPYAKRSTHGTMIMFARIGGTDTR